MEIYRKFRGTTPWLPKSAFFNERGIHVCCGVFLHLETVMKPQLFRVILQVSDIDAATRFYEQILGFKGKRVSPGRHYFDCDGAILVCLDPRADGDEFDALPNVDYVYIAVTDVVASFQAATSAGASLADGDVHGAPSGAVAERPWGERSFYAADPFGNKLCFVDQSTMFTG